jgi:hypothetical protein
MKFRWFVLLAIAAVWGGTMVGGFLAVDADTAFASETCPHTGGWTKIDSGDLSLYPVDGADGYCFKAGTETYSSKEAWEASGKDLSHWSYHMPDPTQPPPPIATPTDVPPTETPTDPPPTETPTEPPPTPTDCPECDPTPTPTDPPPTDPPPTDPPPKETPELPKTGVSPLEVVHNAVWQEDDLPDNLYLAHQGMAAGPNVGLEWVMLRANQIYNSVYMGNIDYWITGRLIVDADDMWVLDLIEEYDGIVMMTCSQFMPEDGDPNTGEWAKRVIIFAQPVGE